MSKPSTPRICLRCDRTLPSTEFHRDKSRPSGYKERCRSCMNVRPIREPLPIGLKLCTRCEQVLPTKQFSKCSNALDGLQHNCRECQSIRRAEYHAKNGTVTSERRRLVFDSAAQRDRSLRKRYGIGQADYDVLLAAQNGGCAVCAAAPGKRPLAVDHCHSTGVVRGLLCYRCNIAAAYIELPELVDGIRQYLARSSAA